MIRVFIGYDPREEVAFHTLASSIMEHATRPVAICPLKRQMLNHCHSRDRGRYDSTEFAITRFLVPYLCDYQGWAIFMDCDMLVTRDIRELWECQDEAYAVMTVPHPPYAPPDEIKFLGQQQTDYPFKNWSSVMLFNNAKCRALTPEYVAKAPGLDLHQFEWSGDIGKLPAQWNHLVGVSHADPKQHVPANIHYTSGGPWFEDYATAEFADLWNRQLLHRVLRAG